MNEQTIRKFFENTFCQFYPLSHVYHTSYVNRDRVFDYLSILLNVESKIIQNEVFASFGGHRVISSFMDQQQKRALAEVNIYKN